MFSHIIMTKRTNILVGYSCAIFAAAFFGSVSTVSKPVLATVNPVLLSSLVYIISGLTFTPIAQKTGRTKVSKKYYYLVLISATIGAAAAPIMFFTGLKLTTAADTALLSNGETVFSILFALLFFKEKLKRVGYGAVALILVGVFIVTTNFHFDSSLMQFNSGNILVIAATVLWGLDNNISKIITRHMHISRLVQLKSLIGGSISLLVVLLMGIPFNVQQTQIIPIVTSWSLWICYIALSLFTQHKETWSRKGIILVIFICCIWSYFCSTAFARTNRYLSSDCS